MLGHGIREGYVLSHLVVSSSADCQCSFHACRLDSAHDALRPRGHVHVYARPSNIVQHCSDLRTRDDEKLAFGEDIEYDLNYLYIEPFNYHGTRFVHCGRTVASCPSMLSMKSTLSYRILPDHNEERVAVLNCSFSLEHIGFLSESALTNDLRQSHATRKEHSARK